MSRSIKIPDSINQLLNINKFLWPTLLGVIAVEIVENNPNKQPPYFHVAVPGRAELSGHREDGGHSECHTAGHCVFVDPETEPRQTNNQH